MDSQTVQGAIDEMVRRIVEGFQPEKIILFGSHARGEVGPDSDVDLLVVMPIQGSRRGKAIEIDLALSDRTIPLDLIVGTPDEFEQRKDIVGTIERPAAREGKVVYERVFRDSAPSWSMDREGGE